MGKRGDLKNLRPIIEKIDSRKMIKKLKEAQKKLVEQKKAEQTLKSGFKANTVVKDPLVCGDKLCSDSKFKPIPVSKSLKEEQMKTVKKFVEQLKAAKIIKRV